MLCYVEEHSVSRINISNDVKQGGVIFFALYLIYKLVIACLATCMCKAKTCIPGLPYLTSKY